MKDVETNRNRSQMAGSIAEARTGLFRATLLFGSIAGALSLIIVPASDRHSRAIADEQATDAMITGSIAKPGSDADKAHHVAARRGTFGPCLLFPDGSQKGAC